MTRRVQMAMLLGLLFGCDSDGGSDPTIISPPDAGSMGVGADASPGPASDTGGGGGDAAPEPTSDASAGGAPGPDADDADAAPPPVEGHISQTELARLVGFLADDALDGRDEGTPGGDAARDYIIDELHRCGVEPFGDDPLGDRGFEQRITNGDGTNIIGRIAGTDPDRAHRAIIISAHYDHLGGCRDICNGADDNAAGVAILITAACEIAQTPQPRTVIVAAWDAEEPPTFLSPEMGSQFYVDHPLHPLDQTDVMVALDLVGGDMWSAYPFQVVLGGELSPEVAAALDATPIPDGLPLHRGGLHLVEDTPLGHQPWSDYDAFRNRGVPALFVSNGQTKYYHEASDHPDTLNVPKMVREAVFLRDLVRSLGAAVDDPVFVRNGADHRRDADTVQAIVTEALAVGGLIDALNLGAASRAALERDLVAVEGIAQRLDGGGSTTAADVTALRNGAQRIMCLAGPLYPEAVCSSF